ncbi:HD-GYP domain-containing protein [Xylophilus sp. GOD-11R]|uniref:HD-GYP domain-containing protein n=1 Tax=Xylophilus sp. GOD-11R TaxID=3089814 RepID=UPI00298D0E65|nr:HD domain-containing phosphohydrolase [Xylophilus sp. GOD-11R]WPB57996.1 HD domain-containing phosphohydrolase [Xylophilus sp. GOD-11R]
MQLIPFDEVRLQVVAGAALPWDVRTASGELLLARGQVVRDIGMADALQARGAFVDIAVPGMGDAEDGPDYQDDTLPNRWLTLEARIGGLLRAPGDGLFLARLRQALASVVSTAQEHSDELVYLILRHDHTRLNNYGVAHALHCAALCAVLAQRIGWSGTRCVSLVGAALTMNMSILDLQGRLASEGVPPTEAEREEIAQHPLASARMLRAAGLSDAEWLLAVEQHHEVHGGGGYPNRVEGPSEMSQLLRLVDIFTAKHSPRTGRGPLPAHQAARELFLQSRNDPFASILIKELGIYPPGCFVLLAGGETAVVTHVGESARTPKVAVIINRHGEALMQPLRRDTALPQFAIQKTVPDRLVRVAVSADVLYGRRPTYL